jgi:hypothetical protein
LKAIGFAPTVINLRNLAYTLRITVPTESKSDAKKPAGETGLNFKGRK